MESGSRKSSQAKRVSLGVGGALVERPDEPGRGVWSNQIEFVLSCIGYAVGIGNVWRFPLFIYRNGGGAFLIPFIIMLITMGMPIFFLELCMGQYTGFGPVKAYLHMAPAFHGLGYCTLVVILLVMIYYMVIVAWTIFYTFASFSSKLAWAYCDNDFNTNDCYSGLQDAECQKNNSSYVFFNKTCMNVNVVCKYLGFDSGNTTHCMFDNKTATARGDTYNRILASEEYFRDYVLGLRGATWENFGSIRWELFGCLTLAWIMCYFCLVRGIQSVGKVVYFTALFPYLVLTILLIRGVTLEGADEGVLWYIRPDFSTLNRATVWADAASQVFYSLGIGCGSLLTLASYSKFDNNCHRDAIFVTFANLFTSIFAGFVIFSILGFLAREIQMPIEKVVQSAEGLAFIAYPEAVVRMPVANLWAILFFFMLTILGLGSQFAGVQAINTAILDRHPDLRKYEAFVILGICMACWLLAIPMVFDGGIYLFKLMDWHTASWAVLLIGFAEVAVASLVYGCNKFLDNLAEMKMKFGRYLRAFWWLCWVILAPLTCLGVFVYQLDQTDFRGSYGSYVFPVWTSVIGIGIGLATLVPLPVFFFIQLWKTKNIWVLFRPTKLWRPAVEKNVLDNDSVSTAVVNPAYASSDKV